MTEVLDVNPPAPVRASSAEDPAPTEAGSSGEAGDEGAISF